MPLFVPTDALSLDHSRRIGGSAALFDMDDQDSLSRAVREALYQASSTDEGAWIRDVAKKGPTPNIRLQEVSAYCALLGRDAHAGLEGLGALERHVARYPWEQEVVDRARHVASLLRRSDLDSALRTLESWRDETVQRLKLRLENLSP